MANNDPANRTVGDFLGAGVYLAGCSGDAAANNRALDAVDVPLPRYLHDARGAMDYVTFGMHSGDVAANGRAIDAMVEGIAMLRVVESLEHIARLGLARIIHGPEA